MRNTMTRIAAAGVALSLSLALGACGGIAQNGSLDSVHQPIVQRNSYVMDLNTDAGGGLTAAEARRLAGWFGGMNLRYGDKIALDDPTQSGATRAAVEGVAARYGMLLANTAPITPGYVSAGSARVVVTRVTAEVPGCPDWEGKSDFNPKNATSQDYGCAINGNLAAMVADKEHLIHGATGNGETVVMSSSKAIDSYRAAKPTGEGGLKAASTGGGN
jgi:pilus assembly protein CpaD